MRSTASRKAESTVQWSHDVLELTWEEVADILGTTSRTLQRWREQGTTPLRENAERVEKLDELRFWLEAVFEGDWERARSWLNTRVMDLRGKAPMELIRRRRLDKVIELLATAHEGAFI
jgi:uncharacterized protein (DUF2384 family)